MQYVVTVVGDVRTQPTEKGTFDECLLTYCGNADESRDTRIQGAGRETVRLIPCAHGAVLTKERITSLIGKMTFL